MNFEDKTSKQNPFFRSHLARQTRILLALSSDLFLLNKKRNTRVFVYFHSKGRNMTQYVLFRKKYGYL